MTQRISTYGLIGFPLGHSLSPVMHNTAFKALGLQATYKLLPLQEDHLDHFFQELKKEESPIFGLNVTVPYKEAVISYLDSLNPYAQKVKAVNTIVIDKDRKLIGLNTDGPGFLAHFTELGVNIKDKRVAILGAGGAARAVLSTLCMIPERPKLIKIFDSEREKAETLVQELRENLDLSIVEIAQSIDDLNIELSDILINATPIGLKTSDPALIEEELLHPNMFVYDLVYNPAETKLLKMAAVRGAKTSNGLGMLFYQGVLAFQHWAEIELPDEIKDKMKQALVDRLKGK
ncbi:MAG: shikimate dehydrogenase [Candidatus Aceula meridiana]|nr:shikimate dehydrogenase [Candidatus Aceula meridiana]